MKKSSTLTMIAIAIAISGCAAPSFIPPSEHDKETSRQYDHSYQVSWDAVLDLVTVSGFRLEQVSKDSGYISIAHNLHLDSSEADCGVFEAGGTLQVYTMDAVAHVAIRFKELSDDRSEVNVVVTGEKTITGKNAWSGAFYKRIFPCESTGELERQVLDYVSNYKG